MTAVAGSTSGISGSSTSGDPLLQRDAVRTAAPVGADAVRVDTELGVLCRADVPVVAELEVVAVDLPATLPHTVQ
jgi:hypothetical protein